MSIRKNALYIFFCLGWFSCTYATNSVVLAVEGDVYTVERAIDSDTFKLSNGQTLKLAGINTPELHDTAKLTEEAKRFGKEIWSYRSIGGEAHKAVQHLLEMSGQKIRLESNGGTFDEEGNLVANVYIPVKQLEPNMVPDDQIFFDRKGSYEIFLNACLLKLGFARVVQETVDPKYQELFSALEWDAQENKRGLWGL